MKQFSYILFAAVVLGTIGCSELEPGMSQDPTVKCETCHEMPKKNKVHVLHLDYLKFRTHDTLDCDACHKAYDPQTGWTMDDSWHRNGIIDTVPGECDYCHDFFTDCENCHFSPPRDVDWDPPLSVKMHNVHTVQQSFLCDECHAGYSLDPKRAPRELHSNGDTTILFNTYVPPGAQPPFWDRATKTCYNLYCHGATLVGGKTFVKETDTKPQDSTQCSFCHDLTVLRDSVLEHSQIPPQDQRNFMACFNCHPDGFSAQAFATVDSLHGDGLISVDREAMHALYPNIFPAPVTVPIQPLQP